MHRTIDYETSAGTIFLVNKDKKQLQTDLDKVNDIIKNHLDQIFEIVKPPKQKKQKVYLRDLVNEKGKKKN
ncbi:MAG: hypothetical protein MJ233_05230 [Mycoplasmoidaceae bacterium]|nr:hypothetical protein [Mycoplasmoidaceae bacterium]